MATGDIISVAIRSDGWSADVTVDGFLATEVAYDFGLIGTTPTAPKMTLTATSKGYSAAGVATTHERTILGTVVVRKPYPNNAVKDETNNAGNTMTVRVALSEPIFAKDKTGVGNSGTDVSASIEAGWATWDAIPSNAAVVTCTNNSGLAYPKPIVKRAWFNYEKIRASVYDLEIVPIGYYVLQNRPFACVKATLSDESANSIQATITKWDLSPRTTADPVSVVTCNHSFSLATMDKHQRCTINYQVYPWIGDSDTIVDSTGQDDRLPEVASPIYFFNDKDSDYPASIAMVDFVSGVDGTGVATAIDDLTTARASPFKTIIAAREAIVARNLAQHSRQDLNGSIIYLKAGTTHQWVGDGTSAARSDNKITRNTDKCELLITRDPASADRDAVVLERGSSWGVAQNQIKTQNYRIYDITIGNTQTSGLVSGLLDGTDSVVLHGVKVNQTSVTAQLTFRHQAVTFVSVLAVANSRMALRGGPDSPSVEQCVLARGNTGGHTLASQGHCLIGNFLENGSIVQNSSDNHLVYMNRIGNTANGVLYTVNNAVEIEGFACVGNCFVTRNTSTNGYGFSNESSPGAFSNAIIAYNSFLGQGSGNPYYGGRMNFFYSESVATGLKTQIYHRHNYYRQFNHKNDIFAANGSAASNWFVTMGAGQSGNCWSEDAVLNTDFNGLYTKASSTDEWNLDFANPTDNSAITGNFTPGANSALNGLVQSQWAFMPIDINGNVRQYSGGAAGAYARPGETNPASATGLVEGTVIIRIANRVAKAIVRSNR